MLKFAVDAGFGGTVVIAGLHRIIPLSFCYCKMNIICFCEKASQLCAKTCIMYALLVIKTFFPGDAMNPSSNIRFRRKRAVDDLMCCY